MRPLDFKPTNHSYACSTTRWNQHRDEVEEFDCWKDFKESWDPDDYNHLFHFYLCRKYEWKTDAETGPMQLLLFFMLQRKGLFVPVTVNNITEADMPEITEFLKERWEYLKGQWAEFSTEPEPLEYGEIREYIEKAPLIDFIAKGLSSSDKIKRLGHDAIEIMTEIEYTPAANVKEIIYATWEEGSGDWLYGTDATKDYKCSSCKSEFVEGGKYCPECGATMRKEE